MPLPALPLILEPDQLEEILHNDDLLIVDVCQPGVYERVHVPGAVHINPGALVCGTPPAPGKLPDEARLNELFSSIGYDPGKHIVAYDDEGGGWAGRFLWTLDVIGHKGYSYLNGGIHAWNNEGHPVESDVISPDPGKHAVVINHEPIADLSQVLAQIPDTNSVVWDARSAEEYQGLKSGSARKGHIPGAVNLDWLDTMDASSNFRLLPLGALRQKLEALGIGKDQKVITHCQSHHRSGLTYLIGKALGLDIRAYDGSWSEWGNREDTPVET
ncbi:MAG: sulfurtransferase [Gammaproteobacteria bacterium]|nr:sulfurtransferase [Gammaproteobacteria bacterium]